MATKKATKKVNAPKQAESVNNTVFSGRICERGLKISDKGTARFALAHNMGPKAAPVFLNCVMFPKNGSKEVNIPVELIKKGQPVIAKGYLRNGDREYTPNGAAEGETKLFRQLDLVVLELLDNTAAAEA